MRKIICVAMLCCLFATAALAQDAAIPDLKGAWESSSHFHHKDIGYDKAAPKTGKMVIASQDGRIFEGAIEWKTSRASGQDAFSGVIEKDNKTLLLAAHGEFTIRVCKIDGPDAITMYVLTPGGDKPRAGLVEFTRVKP